MLHLAGPLQAALALASVFPVCSWNATQLSNICRWLSTARAASMAASVSGPHGHGLPRDVSREHPSKPPDRPIAMACSTWLAQEESACALAPTIEANTEATTPRITIRLIAEPPSPKRPSSLFFGLLRRFVFMFNMCKHLHLPPRRFLSTGERVSHWRTGIDCARPLRCILGDH